MSIFGTIIDYVLQGFFIVTPCVVSSGFLLKHFFGHFVDLTFFDFPSYISKEETSLLFKSHFSELSKYSSVEFSNVWESLINNDMFSQCILDWIHLENYGSYDGILNRMKCGDIKNSHIDLLNRISKCTNIQELRRLNLKDTTIHLIVKSIFTYK